MPTYPDQEERTEAECMAHGCRWRSRFHCILNQLRANKDISKLEKSDIDRIPYAVCTCSVTPTGLQNGKKKFFCIFITTLCTSIDRTMG